MEGTNGSLIGQVVADRYKVLSELGSGGFGAVYMAKHIELNNPVAIKVLHAHLIREKEHVIRFRREAVSTSRLKHNSIASVFDVGVLPDGRPYMVMEYLTGKSLASILEEEGPMPVARALPLFIECTDALRYAHLAGLLHRDIKPDNIFVVKDIDGIEHVKLLDFGLSKAIWGEEGNQASNLTDTGIALGTPWYMSPEQCQALPLDARSDLYSLACTLYETVSGVKPFPGVTHYQIMHAHLHEPIPPINTAESGPVVPPALEDAILRAMAKSPKDRFSGAEDFKQALLDVQSDQKTPLQSQSRPMYRNAEAVAAAMHTPMANTFVGAKSTAQKELATAGASADGAPVEDLERKAAAPNSRFRDTAPPPAGDASSRPIQVETASMSTAIVIFSTVIAVVGFTAYSYQLAHLKPSTVSPVVDNANRSASTATQGAPRATGTSVVTPYQAPPPVAQPVQSAAQNGPSAADIQATQQKLQQLQDTLAKQEEERKTEQQQQALLLQQQQQQQALLQQRLLQQQQLQQQQAQRRPAPEVAPAAPPTQTTFQQQPPSSNSGSNSRFGGLPLPPGVRPEQLPSTWKPGDPLPPGVTPTGPMPNMMGGPGGRQQGGGFGGPPGGPGGNFGGPPNGGPPDGY